MTDELSKPAALPPGTGPVCDPIVEELLPAPPASEVFRRLATREHCVFFDSARFDDRLGRYSFVACDPYEFLEIDPDQPDALGRLERRLASERSTTVAGLPPFQGGAAGLVSYDLGRQLERLPAPHCDEFRAPALAIGLYDVVVAFDHVEHRAWILSHGWPERDPAARRDRAARRLREMRALIDSAELPASSRRPVVAPLPVAQLAPQFIMPQLAGLTSNFDREGYLAAASRVIEYIRAGDIFQANLAQRLLYPAVDDALDLYLRLRERNPATFAGYFDLGAMQILSASPERFLQVHDGQVEARPIKGTRRRTNWPEADLYAGDDLRQSSKDWAENVMIVDLLRNDLSRVCRADSVQVTQLCGLETYEFVQHLVSAVCGTLSEGRTPLDLLRAAFPGGSITGAPKVRAMEIIAELEPTARGAYCGSLVYLGYNGQFDSSILIRTVTAARGWWQVPVGGGITAQSNPADEYEETWHKAEGMLRALR